MAKKTYKTYCLKSLQLLLFGESGRTIEVNFKGGLQVDSTAKFSTNDEEVQKALEKCSGFKRDFYLDSVREDTPAAAPAAETPSFNKHSAAEEVVENGGKQKVEVADKSEAVEWLKEHFPEEGYTAVKLRTMAAVNEAGKKHGVVFELA